MERPARAKARELAGDAAPRNCEGRPSCRSALGPATVLKGRAAASERAPGTVCRDGQGANRSRRVGVGNLSGQPGGLQEGERLLLWPWAALLHLVDIVGDQPPWGFLVHARGLPPTGQLRPERVAIRATTSEPAVTSPAATTRRTAIGGSGRRRQPPRAGAAVRDGRVQVAVGGRGWLGGELQPVRHSGG